MKSFCQVLFYFQDNVILYHIKTMVGRPSFERMGKLKTIYHRLWGLFGSLGLTKYKQAFHTKVYTKIPISLKKQNKLNNYQRCNFQSKHRTFALVCCLYHKVRNCGFRKLSGQVEISWKNTPLPQQ